MKARIYLNGTLLDPSEYEGVDRLTVTIKRVDDEGRRNVKSATGELRFYGSAYTTLRDELVTPADGKLRYVPARLVVRDDSGDEVELVSGVVKGSEIDWCDDECYITASIVEHDDDSKAVDCVKSTLVYDDHAGILSAAHPRIVYCDEIRPEWLHHVILISSSILLLLFDILYPVVLVTYVIVSIVNAIIGFVNNLGANIDEIDLDGDPDTNLLNEWQNLKNNLVLTVIGCGRKHPSPLLRTYITNVCDKCGITFQSSILNDPSSEYYNTVLFNAPVKKGTRDDTLPYIYENRPIASLETLLDDVGTVHNADWVVKDGVLHYERKDRLPTGGTWFDPEQLKSQGRIVTGVCYQWDDEEPAAYATYEYTEDPMDEPGNEAKEHYSEVVEWNSPFSEMQRGEKKVLFPFGMVRNRMDGVENDVLDAYRWLWYYSSAIAAHDNALLVSRGIAAYPKLLIWDGYSTNFATVRQWPGKPLPHNYAYQLNEDGVAPHTVYEPNEPDMALYGRFHAIDNPRVNNGRGWRWSLEFEATCADLQSINVDADIPLAVGTGQIDQVTINIERSTIFAEGTV